MSQRQYVPLCVGIEPLPSKGQEVFVGGCKQVSFLGSLFLPLGTNTETLTVNNRLGVACIASSPKWFLGFCCEDDYFLFLHPWPSSLSRFRSAAVWCTATTVSMSRWCQSPQCPSFKVVPTFSLINWMIPRQYPWMDGCPTTPTSLRTRWTLTGCADQSAPSPAPVSYKIPQHHLPCWRFLSLS